MALFISMRKPRLTWTSPLSSTHGTRNMITRSGSEMRSRTLASRYLGFLSRTTSRDSATSSAAWWNSASAGFLALSQAMYSSTNALM